MHRAEITFSTSPDFHRLAVFLAALPIGGYRLARMSLNGRPDRPRLILWLRSDEPTRPLSETGEWLKDAALAAGLSPEEITLDTGPLRRRRWIPAKLAM